MGCQSTFFVAELFLLLNLSFIFCMAMFDCELEVFLKLYGILDL